ncbi:MAG: hypothetical protein RR068_15165 [Hafnia sp.]
MLEPIHYLTNEHSLGTAKLAAKPYPIWLGQSAIDNLYGIHELFPQRGQSSYHHYRLSICSWSGQDLNVGRTAPGSKPFQDMPKSQCALRYRHKARL